MEEADGDDGSLRRNNTDRFMLLLASKIVFTLLELLLFTAFARSHQASLWVQRGRRGRRLLSPREEPVPGVVLGL